MPGLLARLLVALLLAAPAASRGQSLGEVALAAENDTPGGPEALAFDGRHIWVARPFADALVKLSASNAEPSGTFRVERPGAVLYALSALWVTNTRANRVTKLDPRDGALLGSFEVGHAPAALAFDGESIWVANSGANSLTKLDPKGRKLLTVGVQARPLALAFDGAHLWVASNKARSVTKLRAKDGRIAGVFPAGDGPSALAFDGENIWVANFFSGDVMKLRAADGERLGAWRVAPGASGLAFDGRNIWVTSWGANSVTALRGDGSVMASYGTGRRPQQVLYDGANLWLANSASDSVSSTALGWK
jgi:DNA-binding beta-propeller fold protein YncE